uniref:Uncharacterized protein n=1 Tax=Brassica oleracea var. oleracea TaxID=109376 RepID=A0A0D3CR66_BRAOL
EKELPFGSRNHYRRRLSNLKKGFSLSSILNQTPFLIQPTSRFSSAGRGRGRGSGFPAAGKGQFGINSEPEIAKETVAHGGGSSESQSPGGYGRPIQSDLNPPPFTAFVRSTVTAAFSIKEATSQPPESKNISNALGNGAGQPFVEAAPPQLEENCHIRRSQPPPQPKHETPRPQLSPEEAGRRSRSQLSHGEAEGSGGIECEPEYLMPDFGSNPDIDEKPPMPLRNCLEKEAIDEAMKEAPLMKDIVDHYSGPDRVTAKTQNEELDRIATTVPQSAPDSVKRFADRVALSLKSNLGWGYDKKYQFMDKLVLEASQSYK